MTLCEALDWCRANRAVLYFGKYKVALVCSKGKASGATIEEAVQDLVRRTTVTEPTIVQVADEIQTE